MKNGDTFHVLSLRSYLSEIVRKNKQFFEVWMLVNINIIISLKKNGNSLLLKYLEYTIY